MSVFLRKKDLKNNIVECAFKSESVLQVVGSTEMNLLLMLGNGVKLERRRASTVPR